MITLLPHQKLLVESGKKKLILHHSTGTGKTIAAIAMMYHQRPPFFFVVCPKRVKDKWISEISEYEKSIGYTIPHTVVTKEAFKKIPLEKIVKAKACIFDEIHNHVGVGSDLQKHTSLYCRQGKPDIIYALSATPYRASPWNVYYLVKFMGGSVDYPEFKRICFREGDWGTRVYEGKDCKEYLSKMLAPFIDSMEMNEVVDVPEAIHKVIDIIKPEHWVSYEYSEYDNPLSWLAAMHQIEAENPEKLEKIVHLWKKYNSCVVVCRFTKQIEMYKHHFDSLGISNISINGRSHKEDISKAQHILDAGGIVLVQAQVAEGYELPQSNCMIFASQSYSYVDWKQACGRIQRINRIQQCYYYYLITTGGIDDEVYNSVISKMSFNVHIYTHNMRKKVLD